MPYYPPPSSGSTPAVVSANLAVGSVTIATDKFVLQGKRLVLVNTERATLEGTGRMILVG